jgi:hypothetical protein
MFLNIFLAKIYMSFPLAQRVYINTYLMLGIPQPLPGTLVILVQDVNQPSPSNKRDHRKSNNPETK